MLGGGVAGLVFLCLQLYASYFEIWPLYVIGFACSLLCLNVVYSSMVGLTPDCIDDSQIGAVNGVQAVLNVLGALLGMGIFYYFLAGSPLGLYLTYIVLVFATIAVTLVTVDEPLPECDDKRQLIARIQWTQLKQAYWVSPTDHPDFFWVTVSRTLYYMGISAQTFFMYFLRDIVQVDNAEQAVTILSAVAQVCAAFTAYPVGLWSDKLGQGRKKFIYVSCALLAIGNLSFIFCRRLMPVIIISGIVGCGNGAYLAMDSALAVDCIPNKAEAARYLGIWGVACFVGTALGPMVGGPLLYWSGKTATGGYNVHGYALLLGMSAVYFFAAATVLSKVKK